MGDVSVVFHIGVRGYPCDGLGKCALEASIDGIDVLPTRRAAEVALFIVVALVLKTSAKLGLSIDAPSH